LSRIEINVKIILDAGSFKIQRRSRNVWYLTWRWSHNLNYRQWTIPEASSHHIWCIFHIWYMTLLEFALLSSSDVVIIMLAVSMQLFITLSLFLENKNKRNLRKLLLESRWIMTVDIRTDLLFSFSVLKIIFLSHKKLK
jgi:hypothetical protein